ncbi:MAG: DUF1080 domain-containing protein [Marinilabiliales bacterium]|nr:DUF1080 domain-containing protein [Marinilabiliales bacterium]
MKIRLLALSAAAAMCVFGCNLQPKKVSQEPVKQAEPAKVAPVQAMNTLSEAEAAQGWLLLFNGKTGEGWRGVNKKDFPAGWVVDDNALKCVGSGNGEAGAANGGDILYATRKFSNFDLKIEWKISPGGNSGIFYLGDEVKGKEIWRSAPEFQVLDNDRHPDALLGKDGNRKAGSLYDLIPAKPQNTKPAGEWNSAEIICYQGTVVHKQNGETIVEYHLWTPEWNEMVKNSKFPSYNKNWANVPKEGYIALQDHGNDVWFRNIKIRPL